ncbi:hypothetical protein ACFQ3Z_32190 [Streptomyces nogalater]
MIEVDGWSALLWAVLLLVPSALVSSALLFPLRARLRSPLVLGWLTTFLTAVLLPLWTPGLRMTSLWPRSVWPRCPCRWTRGCESGTRGGATGDNAPDHVRRGAGIER